MNKLAQDDLLGRISAHSFVQELELIKRAEEDTPFESKAKTLMKNRLVRSMVPYAVGAGVGAGTGMLVGELTRPWMLKHMGPKGRMAAIGASGGLGMIGTVAMWRALEKAMNRDEG